MTPVGCKLKRQRHIRSWLMGDPMSLKPTRIAALLLLIGAGMAMFQNCGPQMNFVPASENEKQFVSEAGGNGHGYGGKLTYFVRLLDNGLCSDGSPIEARIGVASNGSAWLDRENCRTLVEPRTIAIVIASDELSLSYEGTTFTRDFSTQPTPTPAPVATSTPTPAPTAPAPTPPISRNFVAGDQASCEAAILQALGRSGACSMGGGCTLDGQVPSPSNPSANPSAWGACLIQ